MSEQHNSRQPHYRADSPHPENHAQDDHRRNYSREEGQGYPLRRERPDSYHQEPPEYARRSPGETGSLPNDQGFSPRSRQSGDQFFWDLNRQQRGQAQPALSRQAERESYLEHRRREREAEMLEQELERQAEEEAWLAREEARRSPEAERHLTESLKPTRRLPQKPVNRSRGFESQRQGGASETGHPAASQPQRQSRREPDPQPQRQSRREQGPQLRGFGEAAGPRLRGQSIPSDQEPRGHGETQRQQQRQNGPGPQLRGLDGQSPQQSQRPSRPLDSAQSRYGSAFDPENYRGRFAPKRRDQFQGQRASQPPKRRRKLLIPLLSLVLVGAVAAGIFLFATKDGPFSITVNGIDLDLEGVYTLTMIVDDGHVHPQPGNMLALDGLLAEEGRGERFRAVVNGKVVSDLNTRLRNGDVVIISDGGDLVEPFTELLEVVPFGIVDDGSGPVRVIEGVGCDGTRKAITGSVSGLTIYEDVVPVVNQVSRNTYPSVGNAKLIALTFDDGPWAYSTAEILDILAENNAKATFFTLGELIKGDMAVVVKRASDEGHQICTHSYSHARYGGNSIDLASMSDENQLQELLKGYEAIHLATGKEVSTVFRSPGGYFNANTQRLLAPYISAEVGWTVDSGDWKQPGVTAIANEIKSAGPGSIILLHDGGGDRSQTVEALRIALPYLVEQGYRFVTIDEIMGF
ncbi:MAG: polysaccharide deacetylase family protein [Eggerthellaceae bacterium]|nr:polysaccharide deacetylase family protein [Eggerthellaceae bacterium]